MITWFTDFFFKKIGSEVEKKKSKKLINFFCFNLQNNLVAGKIRKVKKTKSSRGNLRFFIIYQYFFYYFFFYFYRNAHRRGKKKKDKNNFSFFLKMARIQVGGIRKPRNKNKKALLLFFIPFLLCSLTFCLLCLGQPGGHLLGKSCPLGFLLGQFYLICCFTAQSTY